jgi:hypothetical protein
MFASLIQAALAATFALSTLAASPSPRQEVAQPMCSTVNTIGSAQTIEGTGQRNSAPLALDGGAYQVDWQLSSPSDRLTFIRLESATSGSVLQSETILNASGPTPVTSGQTFVYNVKPGSYYLGVRAPGGWSVTLTPISA